MRERQRLLAEGPGLIDPLGFLLTNYQGDNPGRWTFRAGLSVYDLMALQWSHRQYSPLELRLLAPHISEDGLEGGLRYGDAQTDDARLTLRVIQEAVAAGGVALNYVRAESLLRDEAGQVVGVRLHDVSDADPKGFAGADDDVTSLAEKPLVDGGASAPIVAVLAGSVNRRDFAANAAGSRNRQEQIHWNNLRPTVPGSCDVHARVVINATGAWADRLRGQLGRLVFARCAAATCSFRPGACPSPRRSVFCIRWTTGRCSSSPGRASLWWAPPT